MCVCVGGEFPIVSENIPQNIVTLTTNLQAVVVNVTCNKTITLCSVHLPFNHKELQDVIDQIPSPFILMGNFN